MILIVKSAKTQVNIHNEMYFEHNMLKDDH